MKLTKSQLKQIIKEEILKTLNEGSTTRAIPSASDPPPRYRAQRIDTIDGILVYVRDYGSGLKWPPTGLYNDFPDFSYRSGDLRLSKEKVKAALAWRGGPGYYVHALDEVLGMV